MNSKMNIYFSKGMKWELLVELESKTPNDTVLGMEARKLIRQYSTEE